MTNAISLDALPNKTTPVKAKQSLTKLSASLNTFERKISKSPKNFTQNKFKDLCDGLEKVSDSLSILIDSLEPTSNDPKTGKAFKQRIEITAAAQTELARSVELMGRIYEKTARGLEETENTNPSEAGVEQIARTLLNAASRYRSSASLRQVILGDMKYELGFKEHSKLDQGSQKKQVGNAIIHALLDLNSAISAINSWGSNPISKLDYNQEQFVNESDSIPVTELQKQVLAIFEIDFEYIKSAPSLMKDAPHLNYKDGPLDPSSNEVNKYPKLNFIVEAVILAIENVGPDAANEDTDIGSVLINVISLINYGLNKPLTELARKELEDFKEDVSKLAKEYSVQTPAADNVRAIPKSPATPLAGTTPQVRTAQARTVSTSPRTGGDRYRDADLSFMGFRHKGITAEAVLKTLGFNLENFAKGELKRPHSDELFTLAEVEQHLEFLLNETPRCIGNNIENALMTIGTLKREGHTINPQLESKLLAIGYHQR